MKENTQCFTFTCILNMNNECLILSWIEYCPGHINKLANKAFVKRQRHSDGVK